jgi:acylglycerol lipase
MKRARPPLLAALLLAAALAACAPTLQQAGRPDGAFAGPHLEADRLVSFDGSRLGLTRWDARSGLMDGQPRAVIVGVHGMNDYANAFHMAAAWWATQGITTYAYDQRGFGRSPGRGVWAPDDLKVEDLRTIVALVRARYPHAVIAVAGESLGGAVAIEAFASASPPAADRLILLAPAVWGWSTQPLPDTAALWLAAHAAPGAAITPPDWLLRKITPTDNRAELIAMSNDPLMIWGARFDTLYGLVATMEKAWRETGRIRVPTLYLYGAHDEIIPRSATRGAVARLAPSDRTAWYKAGYHLLLRDEQALNVWRDVAAFIADPAAPLPSAAPPITAAELRAKRGADGAAPGHAGL